MKNRSSLRYPGGKTRACRKLDEILNEYFNIGEFNVIVSPFFGGGSFEFYMQNKYNLEIIANDKFAPLYNFWNSCKYNKEQLCNLLYDNSVSKEKFSELRHEIMDEQNPVNQTVSYFIINRCSFSGATLSGGFSLESSQKRFTKSSIDRIQKLDLSRFTISNCDFEIFINTTSLNEALIFLDPPYYLEKKSKLYGNNGDLHENFDHDRLFRCVSNIKNWIMTYNNCEYIKNLYSDFIIIETHWSYGMNKSKKSSEIVIINYQL